MIFDPRAVPPSSWREWLVAGLALSTRRTGAFVAFGAIAVGVHAVAARFGMGVVVVPLALGVGCTIAASADDGRPVLERLGGWSWREPARLLAAGAVPMLGFWLAGALVTALARSTGVEPERVPVAIGGGSAGGVVEALCAAWFLSVAAVLFGASVAIGFLVPLLAVGGVPIVEALRLSLVASGRNVFAILFVAALATTAAIGFLTPFLVVPWVAVVSATLYAAYRDVFLGRSENAPAAARTLSTPAPRRSAPAG